MTIEIKQIESDDEKGFLLAEVVWEQQVSHILDATTGDVRMAFLAGLITLVKNRLNELYELGPDGKLQERKK